MTNRERFIKTLKCEPIGGQVPTFELVFYLTMEAFQKVHPTHRKYDQWNQMSKTEQNLHINDIAQVYIDTAVRYGHSAIMVHNVPQGFENTLRVCEAIREKTGDEYFIMMHGDSTWPIPDGNNMMDFSVRMFEEPEALNEESARRTERMVERARKIHEMGHVVDGFALCADYCFNTNPFFSEDAFEELIAPFLKDLIAGYHEYGFYSIKHSDGNIMPIIKQIADCKPDAIHSLDPQGGVSIPEVRKLIGNDIALCGNVNCGLLQTGTEEQAIADTFRSLRDGMETGRGFIFCTSNCAYTGLPLERYELMNNIWREHGNYDRK